VSYQKQGIGGVINISAKKSGLIGNLFIDTEDGNRRELYIVSTSNNATVKD
jgi:hypothetical protein